MNFPKNTLKTKFPSQMLSQSPKYGPPEDSPPFWRPLDELDFCRYFDRNQAGEIWFTAPSEIQLEKVTKQRWRILGKEGGESSGRDSYGDCGNICKGYLLFRVIFRKFMHRWFQICAQLGSCNVSFLHYRPPKLKYGFFRGSFSQPTSKSKWVGEPD